MYNKDVTKQHGHSRHKISSPSTDQAIFSETADRTHKINTMSPARPMRGGIRL